MQADTQDYTAWSFAKKLGRLIAAILSLGGTERIRTAGEQYDKAFSIYEHLRARLEDLEKDNQAELELIGETTTEGFAALSRAEKTLGIAANNRAEVSNLDADQLSSQIARIEHLSDRRSTALAAAGGAATGSMAAVGAWSLVAMVGTASTGTAIGTLSGAAATSATLAWFGGGSLVAGGAGMAGGEVVLAGIVIVPMLACWGYFSHRKAKRIELQTTKINEVVPMLPTEIKRMEEAYLEIATHRLHLKAACEGLVGAVTNAERKLFPIKGLSRLKRWLVSKIRGRYFKDSEQPLLSDVQRHVDAFLETFNS